MNAENTALIPATQKAALESVETVANQYGLAALENASPIERTLMIAAGTQKLKELLTPELMTPIMALQGTSLGFRTDKDSESGYPLETVRDVTAEAMMRGFRMVGNETNIIAGRFYAAKDGCRRRVLEWPGLREFQLELSFPTDKAGTAYVEGLATWTLDGQPDELKRVGKTAIPIRRNARMGDDAILGKAERKMYAAILNKLSSFVIPDGEVDAEGYSSNGTPTARKRSSLNDYADAPSAAPTQPTFDAEEQASLVKASIAALAGATDAKTVNGIQKEAAQLAGKGRMSQDSLKAVNDAAQKRRAALKGQMFE